MKIISATFLDSGLQKDRCFFLTNCPPIHHLWWMGGFVFLEKYEKRRAAYLAQLSSITVQDECTQPRPRGTLIADQRRACAARPRGNIQGDGWRLRRSGHAEFSLPRGSPPSPAFQFYSSSFYVTHRFFVTFFTEESNVPPPPPLPIKKASPRLSGPASLQYEILAGKAAHYSALSTYMATNSTLSTYISTGTSLTLPRHTLITV